MTTVWDKESLRSYVDSLIDDLDDGEYTLGESWGNDFIEIEIKKVE